ncbi:MAG: hypothetical protein JNN01_07985 [Opitutaceae bacterium]|nr:hypothetical protein [Opitutaceae bacterium]
MSSFPSAVFAGAVLYAKDLDRLAAFYEGLLEVRVTDSAPTHRVLESAATRLILHAIPAEFAASIEIATPPALREDATTKLMLQVRSLAATRSSAAALGGGVFSPQREWVYGGFRVCDGFDPEGNVVQFCEVVSG